MSKTVVLQVADYGGPYSGNFIASLLALDSRLVSSGWQMVYAFSSIAKDRKWFAMLQKSGKRVHILQSQTNVVGKALALVRVARSEHASIIHTHFTNFDVAAILASLVLRLTGQRVKVVWHVHSPWRGRRSAVRRVKDFVKWRLLGRMAWTIVVSDGGYEVMRKVGVRPDKSETICNGIDVGRLRLDSDRKGLRQQLRKQLHVPDDAICLLAFAWDPQIKGADLLVDALRLLNQETGKWYLFLVGDDPLHEYLKHRYGEDFPEGVVVLPAAEDVAHYYAVADMFVSASRREGFSYAVAEAMASGLPVATSDIPGLEWTHQAAGVTSFQPGSVSALVGTVKTIAGWEPAERAQRIASNQQLIDTHYSVTSWAEKVYQRYTRILAGKAKTLTN